MSFLEGTLIGVVFKEKQKGNHKIFLGGVPQKTNPKNNHPKRLRQFGDTPPQDGPQLLSENSEFPLNGSKRKNGT